MNRELLLHVADAILHESHLTDHDAVTDSASSGFNMRCYVSSWGYDHSVGVTCTTARCVGGWIVAIGDPGFVPEPGVCGIVEQATQLSELRSDVALALFEPECLIGHYKAILPQEASDAIHAVLAGEEREERIWANARKRLRHTIPNQLD